MRTRSIAAILAALAMLTACSDAGGGEPQSSGPTAGVGGDPTADVGGPDKTSADVDVPAIDNPVESLDKYKKDPCSMLTSQQAKTLGFPKPQSDPGNKSGASCSWAGYRDSLVSITLQTGEQWALAGYYEVHAENPDAYAYFDPVTIGGFPAVFATDFDQRENGGSCAMTVALTEQDVLRMSNGLHFGTAQRDKPCEQLRQAAELAVKTISSGK